MVIIDETNKIVEKSQGIFLERLVSRINNDLATQYWESITIISLEDLLNLHKEGVITDEEMEKSKKEYEIMFGKEEVYYIKCFIFTHTETEREIKIKNPLEVKEYATEKAQKMINDSEIDLDIIIFKNRDELLEYSMNCEYEIYKEIISFLYNS